MVSLRAGESEEEVVDEKEEEEEDSSEDDDPEEEAEVLDIVTAPQLASSLARRLTLVFLH